MLSYLVSAMTNSNDTQQTFEELLMSQVVSQDALIRLLIKKGIFPKQEILEMVKRVNG